LTAHGRPFTRDELALDPVDLAHLLLGSVLESTGPAGTVAARLVEVEAYRGEDDPASHCYRGRTDRNRVMWGPAGHLYVYFVYGMHFCANVVGREDGEAGAVLLRAGEIVEGVELARKRRVAARRDVQLAQGPARLTSALGIGPQDNGADLVVPGSSLRLYAGDHVPASRVRSGPRVGVAAAQDTPWRFWVEGSPVVSAYRRGGRVRRPSSPNPGK
jgi:DNA-3-methyladenine glycosylase